MKFRISVSLRECSMDSPWYRSGNALMDASGPILVAPLPVAPFLEADIDCFASMPTIIRLAISISRAKQAFEFPAAHTVVHFVLLLPSWGVHQRMLDGRSLVSIRECSDGRQWPHSFVLCSRYALFEFRLVEGDIGFFCTPRIIRLAISITRAKQACEFLAVDKRLLVFLPVRR